VLADWFGSSMVRTATPSASISYRTVFVIGLAR
jgi:hypothetical protein